MQQPPAKTHMAVYERPCACPLGRGGVGAVPAARFQVTVSRHADGMQSAPGFHVHAACVVCFGVVWQPQFCMDGNVCALALVVAVGRQCLPADPAEEAQQVGVAHHVALVISHGLHELEQPDGRICSDTATEYTHCVRVLRVVCMLGPCPWIILTQCTQLMAECCNAKMPGRSACNYSTRCPVSMN